MDVCSRSASRPLRCLRLPVPHQPSLEQHQTCPEPSAGAGGGGSQFFQTKGRQSPLLCFFPRVSEISAPLSSL